jgi:hypothetical protein
MSRFIISLGEDCFPRLFVDKYRLRVKFPVRMPFDGSIHKFHTMCDLIENDFSDYYNPAHIHFLKQNESHGSYFKHDQYDDLLWLHEKTEDKFNLAEQLSKRVNQFRSILSSEKKILLFIHIRPGCAFDFARLEKILACKHPKLDCKIFAFSYFHDHDFANAISDKTIHVNKNYRGASDFMSERFRTNYGKEFTHSILKEICKYLEEDYAKYALDNNLNFNQQMLRKEYE